MLVNGKQFIVANCRYFLNVWLIIEALWIRVQIKRDKTRRLLVDSFIALTVFFLCCWELFLGMRSLSVDLKVLLSL